MSLHDITKAWDGILVDYIVFLLSSIVNQCKRERDSESKVPIANMNEYSYNILVSKILKSRMNWKEKIESV